jgi:hypothetical protein
MTEWAWKLLKKFQVQRPALCHVTLILITLPRSIYFCSEPQWICLRRPTGSQVSLFFLKLLLRDDKELSASNNSHIAWTTQPWRLNDTVATQWHRGDSMTPWRLNRGDSTVATQRQLNDDATTTQRRCNYNSTTTQLQLNDNSTQRLSDESTDSTTMTQLTQQRLDRLNDDSTTRRRLNNNSTTTQRN